jgi:hypothetical protein
MQYIGFGMPETSPQFQDDRARSMDLPTRPISRLRRHLALATALVACAGLGWLWVGLSWPLRLLGTAWALLGAAWPGGFFGTLALALPWLGDQPGGSPRMALPEMGIAGLVIAYQLRRSLGLARPRSRGIDPWILWFLYYSCVTVLASWKFIWCEMAVQGWRFLAINLNHYGTSPTFGFQAAVKLALSVGLYQALRDEPWGERRTRRFFLLALAGVVVASVLGLLDYAHVIRLTWWRPDNAELTRFQFRRLQSLFGHSGWFAEYVCLLAPATLGLGLAAPRPWQRRLGWALAIGLVPVQVLTMQRGEWVALAAGYAAVAVLAMWLAGGAGGAGGTEGLGGPPGKSPARRGATRALTIFGGIVLVSIVGLYVLSPDFRLRASELMTIRDRALIWRSAWELSEPDRLGGIGLGYYYKLHELVYPFGHPYFGLDKVTAHDLYLHLLAERGLIGLGLFLGMLAACARGLAQGWRRGDATDGSRLALRLDARLAVAGGLVAFLADGIVQYAFFTRVEDLLFWIFLGMATWDMPGRLSPPSLSGDRRATPWMASARRLATATLLVVMPLAYGWSHDVFKPFSIWIEGRRVQIGGQKVQLPIPRQGTRFVLRLGAIQPALEQWPQVLTVTYEGRLVTRQEFRRMSVRKATIDLPAQRPYGARLVIEASRVWFPLRDSGYRMPPVTHVGVICSPLKPLP